MMTIDIVLLCPIEVEFGAVRKIIAHPKAVTLGARHLGLEVGQIRGDAFVWNVAVIEPDLSRASFGLKTNNVLHLLKPRYIFLLGVAGGIKDVAVGDMVVETKAYNYEQGKETPAGFAARPDSIKNESIRLLSLARRIARKNEQERPERGYKTYFGAIASGQKVIASTQSESYKNIKQSFNDTLAVEMEAYSFAAVANEFNTAYLNVRCISDLIDEKAKSDAAGSQKMAAERVATFLKQLIVQLPAPKDEVRYTCSVVYTKKQLSFNRFRANARGTLHIQNHCIELDVGSEKTVIRNISVVAHVKMPGDFSKNWVRVKYLTEGKEQELYFSSSSPVGLGAWIGGSQGLLLRFKEYQSQQLQFD
ncbi:MAG: 5'-methylthioadenosine/S-adenosylhomocysteine nucleosidase [Bacteroidota bacterium]